MNMKTILHELNAVLIWMLIITVFVGIPMLFQLLICYKIKNVLARMIPLILLLVAYVSNYAARLTAYDPKFGGWATFGYDVLELVIFGVALGCALGWLVWAIGRAVKKRTDTGRK